MRRFTRLEGCLVWLSEREKPFTARSMAQSCGVSLSTAYRAIGLSVGLRYVWQQRSGNFYRWYFPPVFGDDERVMQYVARSNQKKKTVAKLKYLHGRRSVF